MHGHRHGEGLAFSYIWLTFTSGIKLPVKMYFYLLVIDGGWNHYQLTTMNTKRTMVLELKIWSKKAFAWQGH